MSRLPDHVTLGEGFLVPKGTEAEKALIEVERGQLLANIGSHYTWFSNNPFSIVITMQENECRLHFAERDEGGKEQTYTVRIDRTLSAYLEKAWNVLREERQPGPLSFSKAKTLSWEKIKQSNHGLGGDAIKQQLSDQGLVVGNSFSNDVFALLVALLPNAKNPTLDIITGKNHPRNGYPGASRA